MAAQRDKRSTAGNRMSKVLEEELEDDDFYKTTYGGFEEEEEDGDFDSEQEDSADEVDSDFDNPEDDDNDEAAGSDDDRPIRRKKGVNTKAYKEPNPRNKTKKKMNFDEMEAAMMKPFDGDGSSLAAPSTPPPPKKKKVKENIPYAAADVDQSLNEEDDDGHVRKSSRHSTAKNSYLTHIRKKEREEEEKKKKKDTKKLSVGVRRLTQDELMAEAERTEKKNVKSLENYLKLEESRKKSMNLNKRSNFDGISTIVSLSMTMHNNIEDATTKKKNVDSIAAAKKNDNGDKRIEQEFYIFSDYSSMETHYHECMKTIRPPPSVPVCPVSRKPARYRDPVTNIDYYDVAALKIIRSVYQSEMKDIDETKDDIKMEVTSQQQQPSSISC